MKIISHRGNLNGPDSSIENNPKFIETAVKAGFDVEIDVWYLNNHFYLGHDNPVYQVSVDWLKTMPLWCHCKNKEALIKLLDNDVHCFWHESDEVTLTSKNYIWNYYKNIFSTKKSIMVLPEMQENINFNNFYGICTDYPERYVNLL